MSAFKAAKGSLDTRAAAKEITRGRADNFVASYLTDELSELRENEAGLLCAETQVLQLRVNVHESARRVGVYLPLVPQELATLVLSAAAVSVHRTQAAAALKYDGDVSAEAVIAEVQRHYCTGTGKNGSVTARNVKDLLLKKLYCRQATGWTGGADKSNAGVWLPRALALYEESWTAAVANPRLQPWLNLLPAEWPRLDPDFSALRTFQVSPSASALVVPKSRLGGRDSVIKALEVDAGASIVRDDISFSSAGFIAWQFRCIRSLDVTETAAEKKEKRNKETEKKKVPQAVPASSQGDAGTAGTLASAASASLALLSDLGAEPTNAEAKQLVADLKSVSAASGSEKDSRRPSRAAVVGADAAENAPPNPLGCKCKYQLWVYYPVVGNSALVVKTGGHTGHKLRSTSDAAHLAMPPIAEELIIEAESQPSGITVNLMQRAFRAGQRQQAHRLRAARSVLHNWSAPEPLQGLTPNSVFSSPARARGTKYAHIAASAQVSDDCCQVSRAATVLAEQREAMTALMCCGECDLDTSADSDIEHCSQCHSVFHSRCVNPKLVTADTNAGATKSVDTAALWVCDHCRTENVAEIADAPDAFHPGNQAAGWLPPFCSDLPVCPGSLLQKQQAEYLLRVFKKGSVGRPAIGGSGSCVLSSDDASLLPACSADSDGAVPVIVETIATAAGNPIPAIIADPAASHYDDEAMPPLIPLRSNTAGTCSTDSSASESAKAANATSDFLSCVPSPWAFAAALTGMPFQVASYTNVTDASVASFRRSVRRAGRFGSTAADDTLQSVMSLVDAGWAKIRPKRAGGDTSESNSGASDSLHDFCAFIQSPDMRDHVTVERKRDSLALRIRVCDATFSIGNHALQLFGVLALEPETSIAVPVAWFIVGAPVDTDAIEWCFEQCAEAGIPPAFVTMFDKSLVEFNAAARVAASRWHSEKGETARSAVLEDLAFLANFATDVEVKLAQSLLERTPGGTLYGPRVLPPRPSQLDGFADLGQLTEQDQSALRRVFKPELLVYGRVLFGLARILQERIASRIVPLSPSYNTWHASMRPLLPFTHFVRLDGPIRSFLDDYCLVFALLCLFHVKQALTKQVLSKRGTSTAQQRKQVVAEFISFVESAPVSGWEAPFAAYRAKWEGVVADSWWMYLQNEWLCDEWRCLLFVSEREVFARLYIDTTNGIELVWRVFKYDWLLHRRVSTYAIAFRLLFGVPWEPESAFLSLTGRILFTLAQIRDGAVRPPLRRRVQVMLDKVTPLLQRADENPSFLQLDRDDSCWGVIEASSSQFYSGPTASLPLYEAGVDHPSGAVSMIDDARRKEEHGRNVLANVTDAVAHVQRVVTGQAAADRRRLARQSGTAGPIHRAREPASACPDAAGAILPSICSLDDAERRFSIVRTLVDAANASGAHVHSCDAAQREFESFRYDGRSTGRSRQVIIERGEIVLGYFNSKVVEGIAAFMPRRAAVTVAELANNNAPVTKTLLSAWPMIDISDLVDDVDASVPHFALVYAVLWTATVSVWLAECHRMFVQHETRSLIFPEQLPAGYLAMLFEAWEQLEHLAKDGRGNENYTLPYIGQERHEETAPGTRAGQCGTRAGCPNAVHISFTTGRGSNRRVVSPLGTVRRDVRMLCVLPIDCPLALNFAEAIALAFFAGSGVPFVNNGPTGNKRGMLDARGNLEAHVDVLLRQRLKDWGFKGCSERTLADEPSYWLRRLLAPVEYKWRSGLRLEVPVSQAPGGALQSMAAGLPGVSVLGGANIASDAADALTPSIVPVGAGTCQCDVQVSTAGLTAADTNVRHDVVLSVHASGHRHQPTFLQVVESSRLFNLGDDSSLSDAVASRFTFCLWCNACDCPVASCICKHLVVGRIEYLRDGHAEVWSDSLLAPITHGREKELYASDTGNPGFLADIVNNGTDDIGTDSTSNDICSDSDSDSGSPLRPPRCVVAPHQMPAQAMAYPQMRFARPTGTGRRPRISIATALAEIEQDAVQVAALSSSIGATLSERGHPDELGNAELRVVEQAALALRSHRQRLQKLVTAMHGEALPSLLSGAGGSMLRPLRTVAESAEQARRMRPLAGQHPMYLLSTGSHWKMVMLCQCLWLPVTSVCIIARCSKFRVTSTCQRQ